jgi:hypothetical protein
MGKYFTSIQDVHFQRQDVPARFQGGEHQTHCTEEGTDPLRSWLIPRESDRRRTVEEADALQSPANEAAFLFQKTEAKGEWFSPQTQTVYLPSHRDGLSRHEIGPGLQARQGLGKVLGQGVTQPQEEKVRESRHVRGHGLGSDPVP